VNTNVLKYCENTSGVMISISTTKKYKTYC